MKRSVFYNLQKWKEKTDRKPLIIRGARQVGKTWLMKEFGRACYEKVVYVNLDNDSIARTLFLQDLDVNRIIQGLEIAYDTKIPSENTLIILDEIQEVPQALSSLKYFCEQLPQYHVIAAGSLLGVSLHSATSFPVGKVDFMSLYPLTFLEFLEALGKDKLVELINSQDFEMMKIFRNEFIETLKLYYYIGGMPEVVASFINHSDYNEVRNIQKNVLTAYEMDFSKHAPYREIPRLRMLWNSIPIQLAKENRKFIYSQVKAGSKAKDYENALLWLSDCGLIRKVSRISKPAVPLNAYEDIRDFKVYLLDVGLLGALSDISAKTLIEGNKIFTEFKGALTEQYVCQQLTAAGVPLFYWARETGNAEVDFIIQNGECVLPVEVKAETNLRSRSLKVYCEKYEPEIAVRASMADFERQSWVMNVPLYAVELLSRQDILSKI